jgi:hypothetical protein
VSGFEITQTEVADPLNKKLQKEINNEFHRLMLCQHPHVV